MTNSLATRGFAVVPGLVPDALLVDPSFLHGDLDPRLPASEAYQGMLFLTDVGPGEGAFACVPSIYKNLGAYLDAHPCATLERPVDVRGCDVVEVPAAAGDLVV